MISKKRIIGLLGYFIILVKQWDNVV